MLNVFINPTYIYSNEIDTTVTIIKRKKKRHNYARLQYLQRCFSYGLENVHQELSNAVSKRNFPASVATVNIDSASILLDPITRKKYPSSIFSHNLVRFSIIRSKMFILYVVITILDRDTNCFLKTISIYIWLYISRPVYKHSIFYKRYITMLQEDIISLASFIRHRLLCKASYVCHAFII